MARLTARFCGPFVALLLVTATAFAQLGDPLDLLGSGDVSRLGRAQPDPELTVTLSPQGDDVIRLSLKVELPEGYYTYSQDPGFVAATKIDVHSASGLKALDERFTPDHPAKRGYDEAFERDVEKFFDSVTWSRRYRLDGTSPSEARITGRIVYQICKDNCRRFEVPFDVTVASTGTDAPAMVDDLPPPEDIPAPVEIVVSSQPSAPAVESVAAAPGDLAHAYRVRPDLNNGSAGPAELQFELRTISSDRALLVVTMELEPEYRTYAIDPYPNQVEVPTSFDLTNLTGLEPVGDKFIPVQEPKVHDLDGLKSMTHEGRVSWVQGFRISSGEPIGIAGSIRYQICKTNCFPPKTVEFSLGADQQSAHIAGVQSAVGSFADSAAVDVAFEGAVPSGPVEAADRLQFESTTRENTLAVWLMWSFLGGLILNIMPCVLPVISIKVLSFVQQAGQNPGRILALNSFYAFGVISVFLALALLAVSIQLGWGAQNQSAAFQIVMACVVFAMGLSLLGVYEIPIPGMLSGGHHHQEGLLGAFLTGVFATLLATPCTGPFMGATLFWSLSQPSYITFLIWGTMGLGMASPYLLLGCFPRLIDMLPRPGNWMVLFKQFSGFLLMGTVVWLLNILHGLNSELIIPTLMILVALGLMLWMVGQLYNLSSSARRRWAVRALALLLGGPVIATAISWSRDAVQLAEARQAIAVEAATRGHAENELPWQTFSPELLAKLLDEGKPVLVDFTADWCAICKVNEQTALNTRPTREFVEKHGIVPLYADYTAKNPEIRKFLNRFETDGVPLTIIVPAGNPAETKVLYDQFSQRELLEKLEEAIQAGKVDSGDVASSEDNSRTASLQ